MYLCERKDLSHSQLTAVVLDKSRLRELEGHAGGDRVQEPAPRGQFLGKALGPPPLPQHPGWVGVVDVEGGGGGGEDSDRGDCDHKSEGGGGEEKRC